MTSDNLKSRRQQLGLSQRGLAEALGVNQWTVSAWEQGKQAFPAYLELALEALEKRIQVSAASVQR